MTPEEQRQAAIEKQTRAMMAAQFAGAGVPTMPAPPKPSSCSHCGFALTVVVVGAKRYCGAECHQAAKVAARLEGPKPPANDVEGLLGAALGIGAATATKQQQAYLNALKQWIAMGKL